MIVGMSMGPLRKHRETCAYCGKDLFNGYIIKGKLSWCSQKHYLAWLTENQRWEDESPNG